MYSLPYFKEKDPAKVLDFIRDHPFAFICGSDANARPVATQIPCFIEDRGGDLFLSGHIMKQTDHHLAFEQNPNVLAVFTGAHTYVSASWYTNKQTASTWNYMSVHAKGRIRFLDEAALMQILRYTTDFFEDDPSSPASFDRLPPDYVQKLSRAIVAFEIAVESIENVFKLSQNRDRESYSNIICHLQQRDSNARVIAEEMTKRQQDLFK